jgi:hypothetical protein
MYLQPPPNAIALPVTTRSHGLFRLLDPACFHACFLTFMQCFAEGLQGVVALDGKTLRRSFDHAAGSSPLHLVSAWAADQRLVLG